MPARIAFCITTLDVGGAERQLVELATRLPRDRFEPAVVVLSRPPHPPNDELVRTLAEHSIPVSFLGGRSIWQAPLIYRRLTNWLREERPDLLQCFLAHANVLGAYAGHRLGIPIVAGIRVAEQRLNGHRWLQRRTAPFVERYVCLSQSVADFAESAMRLPREKLVVIPNGVDVARFAEISPIDLAKLGLPPGRRMLLFVGRLDPQKRPDWLLDRLPDIAKELPHHDLVLVGEGPLEDKLRRQATRLGVADRVHFAHWRRDIPRLLAAADLLVLTSAAEGMPNVILEAMAAAKPVVTTEVHGVAELLGDAG
ncbi:MAG: glycosyltransferase, partial [Pirellulales bacterium]